MSREPIRDHPKTFNKGRCHPLCYGVLDAVSSAYPPVTGKLLTCSAPFRRSPPDIAIRAAPRLACVKPAASVHPEPGSNSSLYIHYKNLSLFLTLFSDSSKESTLSIYLFLGTCLYFPSNIIKKLVIKPAFLSSGTTKVRIFFFPANFFDTFLHKNRLICLYLSSVWCH